MASPAEQKQHVKQHEELQKKYALHKEEVHRLWTNFDKETRAKAVLAGAIDRDRSNYTATH
jgi:hypothetical protein